MSSTARHVLQEALLWATVALGGFALIYSFDDLKAVFGPGGSTPAIAERSETKRASPQRFAGEVRLKADARGHFMFPAEVNGRAADFMADTGATRWWF
jgi:aspartyl protease family protein